jgi:hypothetical protein
MSPDFRSRRSDRSLDAREAALWGVVALALGASILQTAMKGIELRRTRASLPALREAVESDKNRYRQLKESDHGLSAAFAGQIVLTREAPPTRVLAAIESILPDGARLDGIALDYGEALAVALVVVARRPEIYDVFLERMESSPDFANLSFGAESREGEVRISINATFVGGGRS